MSPTESELRSALRSGAGDGVDADAVIAHARGVRHARRMRLGSIVGAVVVVGGIAAGVVTLRGGPSAAPGSSTHPGAAAAACPAKPPHLMLPGGGGTGQFGASGPLFAKRVDSLLVCGYLPVGLFRSTTLTGADAQRVADSLNSTPTNRQTVYDCVNPPPPDDDLLLMALDQPAVVVRVGCTVLDNTATNGTAVRNNWTPPGPVLTLMQQLARGGGSSTTTVPSPGRRYSHGPAPRPTR